MIVFRCFPWDRDADPQEPGGALWLSRELQGWGRHDNPDLYGCLYASATPISPVVERLAPFRGSGELHADMLRSSGRALALAAIHVPDGIEVVDLDEPPVLAVEGLRPSLVATRDRAVTQSGARAVFRRHRGLGALRWWSTFEALWANLTIFEGVRGSLSVSALRSLTASDEVVLEAADVLGLAVPAG